MKWTIRTLNNHSNDLLTSKRTSGWILNHIHDATQILDVQCSSGKTMSTSILIAGNLRDERYIYYSLAYTEATYDEWMDFCQAYDEWYELYTTPELTESANPVMVSVDICPQKPPSHFIDKVKNMFSSFTLQRAKPLSPSVGVDAN